MTREPADLSWLLPTRQSSTVKLRQPTLTPTIGLVSMRARGHRFYTIYKFNTCVFFCKKNRTSHDSVSVVRTTFKVYGKKQTLTLSQPKTSKPIVTKFKRRNYVVDLYHQKKSGLIRPGVFAPHATARLWYTLLLFKIYYTFWFFNSPTGESVRPIFTLNTSNDAVLRMEMPFLMLQNKNLIFDLFIRKIRKKITLAPIRKI